jgi:isopentenyldiphosphate isomerase
MPRLPRRPDTPQSEEILPIVDENDIEVGPPRAREIHRKAWRHRAFILSSLTRRARFLLQRRSLLKDTYPVTGIFPSAGHVGVHESYEEAARRELRENSASRRAAGL